MTQAQTYHGHTPTHAQGIAGATALPLLPLL